MAFQSQGKFKRFVKLLISLGFCSADWLSNTLRRLRGKRMYPSCVVLYYHAVPSEQRVLFARQMDMLIRWTRPIRSDTKSRLAWGQRYTVVTLDDGLQSQIDNALPELERRKIPSSVFVIVDWLGQIPNLKAYSSDYSDGQERIMSADQLRNLSPDLVTIGSHTMTHPLLPSLTEKEARGELSESRAKLEKVLNREVKLLSFPYGAFDDRVVEWCRQAGYERVFTTLPVLAFSDPDEFVTGRVWAEPTDWRLEFCLKLLGAYRWLPFAFALKRKVLSMFAGDRILRLVRQSRG